MITRLTFASLATALFILNSPVRGQELLLRYSFDDVANPLADSGKQPAAPGTIIANGSAGFMPNTPSGTGSSFFTGDGNNNYLTTGTAAAPDSGIGDLPKLDGLQAFTLTLWVNLQTVATNDRLMSDGGAPGGGLGGFDFLIQGPVTGEISASNFRLLLSLDGTGVSSSVTTNALNQWVFLAVTYDGSLISNNVTFYTGTTSLFATQLGTVQSSTAGTIDDNNLAFQVAGTTQTNLDRTPSGYFDDVRVYSGAASASFIEGVRLENVPEPSTAALLLCGVAGAGLRRWRRAERMA